MVRSVKADLRSWDPTVDTAPVLAHTLSGQVVDVSGRALTGPSRGRSEVLLTQRLDHPIPCQLSTGQRRPYDQKPHQLPPTCVPAHSVLSP